MTTRTARRSTSSTRTARRSTSCAKAVSANPAVSRKGFGKGRPRHALAVPPAPDSLSLGKFQLDTANKGNGITLLRSLPDNAVKTAFFDPQYPGGVKNWTKLRESKSLIHKRRAELHQMSEATIAKFFRELSRVVAPSGHVFLWVDNFHVRNGIGHWLEGTDFENVDMITWHKNRMGLGQRSRSSAEFVIVLQKKPKRVKGCWTRRNIRSVWEEKVNAKSHTHAKPMELQKALIDATTEPGDLVLDPCAGSFSVMDAALETSRRFIGCDLDGTKRRPNTVEAQKPAKPARAAKKSAATAKRAKAKATTKAVAKVEKASTKPARSTLARVKPATKPKRAAARKSVPKVPRASTPTPAVKAKRVAPAKPKAARKPARKAVRKQARAKVPRELLAGGAFVLVAMPKHVLEMLAANQALWSPPATKRGRHPRAQAQVPAGCA